MHPFPRYIPSLALTAYDKTSTMPQSPSPTLYDYASLFADTSPQNSFDTNYTMNADFRAAITCPLGLTEMENHEFIQVLSAVKEVFGVEHATRAFRTSFRLGSLAVETLLSAPQLQTSQQDSPPTDQRFAPPHSVIAVEYNTMTPYSTSTVDLSFEAHHDLAAVKAVTIPIDSPEESRNSIPSNCKYPMKSGDDQTCKRSGGPFKRKRGLREHLILAHGYSAMEAEEETNQRFKQE